MFLSLCDILAPLSTFKPIRLWRRVSLGVAGEVVRRWGCGKWSCLLPSASLPRNPWGGRSALEPKGQSPPRPQRKRRVFTPQVNTVGQIAYRFREPLPKGGWEPLPRNKSRWCLFSCSLKSRTI